MRRLIPSRLVRLALAAAVAATIVGAVFLLLRRRADRTSGGAPGRVSVRAADGASGGALRPDRGGPVPRKEGEPGTGSGTAEVAPFPPEPILGRPTPEELRLFLGRSRATERLEAFAQADGPLADVRRLDERTRRRLHRVSAAALAVCLLALGARYVEATTFHEGMLTSTDARFLDSAPCLADGCPAPPGCEAACQDGGDGAVTSTTGESEPEVAGPTPVPDPACTPTVGRPMVRPVRPRVTRAVNRQWRRIERWLKANAPKTFRTLRPPARAGTIAVAEAQMGMWFPDDLRASLLRHNGSRLMPGTGGLQLYRYGMYGVKEIRDTWRYLCREDGVDYTDDPRGEWWSGRMIPVGDDQNGEYLMIDSMRRDVAGSFAENGGTFASGPDWTSYYALLKTVADALVSGQPIRGWLAPQVTDGALGWVDVDDLDTGSSKAPDA
ncbi:SMI1/KNR4 family protein [Microtetraspora fusca]|uniref:SMI1/KNR4 family protein n=1 Tax=Microtetraspora fusca TaxID=1997 RepID=UPI00082B7413|nr:SMI1/KNR4 family protein [Microtetraspora fusca]